MIPRLLVVADLDTAGGNERLLEVLRELARAPWGFAIQLRAPRLADRELEDLAKAARAVAPRSVPLFLNGPGALASQLGFDGVHWPERAIPSEWRDAPLPASAAVHSEEAVRRAERAGARFVVFGSVFPPGSKPGEGVGVDRLREIAACTSLPVLAIGGITPERVAPCLAAGAHGVAVVTGVLAAPRPSEAARRYLEALGRFAT